MKLKNIDRALAFLQGAILAAIVLFICVAVLDPFLHPLPDATLCVPVICR
jgi:hypothetical protein